MIRKMKYEGHEEWLDIRHRYIGGSDAGAVIGLNPYKSAYALWAEKTGRVESFTGNLTTKVGSYLEEFVAKMFEEETGKKVRKRNETMVNDLYPFACANIDRAVVGEKALLEIKTTNSFPIMKQLRSTEFPEAYYAQVVHYLAVTGLQKAYLAVLINCREFKVYELERDQAEIDALMAAEKDFWDMVTSDTPPEADGSQSTTGTIGEMYPHSEDFSVDLTGFEALMQDYRYIKDSIKQLTASADEKANQIKAYMKEAARGESQGFRVTYAEQTRRSFDEKGFRKDNPDVDIDSYYKVTSSRVFKITEKKGEN